EPADDAVRLPRMVPVLVAQRKVTTSPGWNPATVAVTVAPGPPEAGLRLTLPVPVTVAVAVLPSAPTANRVWVPPGRPEMPTLSLNLPDALAVAVPIEWVVESI